MGDNLDDMDSKPGKVEAKPAQVSEGGPSASKHLNQRRSTPVSASPKPVASAKAKQAPHAAPPSRRASPPAAPKSAISGPKRETIIDGEQDMAGNGQWMEEDEMEEENAPEENDDQSARAASRGANLPQQKTQKGAFKGQ